jgi:hypothetical protein
MCSIYQKPQFFEDRDRGGLFEGGAFVGSSRLMINLFFIGFIAGPGVLAAEKSLLEFVLGRG